MEKYQECQEQGKVKIKVKKSLKTLKVRTIEQQKINRLSQARHSSGRTKESLDKTSHDLKAAKQVTIKHSSAHGKAELIIAGSINISLRVRKGKEG